MYAISAVFIFFIALKLSRAVRTTSDGGVPADRTHQQQQPAGLGPEESQLALNSF